MVKYIHKYNKKIMKTKKFISLFTMIFAFSSVNIALASEVQNENIAEPIAINEEVEVVGELPFLYPEPFENNETLELPEKAEDIENDIMLISENPNDMENEIMPISSEPQEIEEVKIPSSFGLFFQNLKENIVIAFTFSQDKKIEKRLQYAEDKIEIANKILNSSDTENLEKRSEAAFSIMKNAEKHMNKVQNKEIILSLNNKKEGELSKDFPQAQDLMNQIISIQDNKDRIYSRIENLFKNEDKIEEVIKHKQENHKKQELFLNELKEEEGLDSNFKNIIQNRTMNLNMKKEMDAMRIEDERRMQEDERRMQEQERMQAENMKNQEEVMCTMEYLPVCGEDGNTYPNRCVAEQQNKVKVAYEGECKSNENLNIENNDILPKITEEELERGWYWGFENQKKMGTPDNWIHKGEESRDAMWVSPENNQEEKINNNLGEISTENNSTSQNKLENKNNIKSNSNN